MTQPPARATAERYDRSPTAIALTSMVQTPSEAPCHAPASATGDSARVHRHTVGIAHVHSILQGARARGMDIPAILRRAGIAPALLASPHARVAAMQFAALNRTLRRLLRDELWGLCERPLPPGTFAALTGSLLRCRDAQSALTEGLHRARLVLSDVAPRLHRDGDGQARIVLVRRRPRRHDPDFLGAAVMFYIVRVASWLVDAPVPVQAVHFDYAAPTRARDTDRLFNAPVRYAQPWLGLTLAADWLTRPVVRTQEDWAEFRRGMPSNLVLRYRNPDSLAERIRSVLRASPAQPPSLSELAIALRVSPATVRRHLLRQDSGYRQVLDSVRRDLAIDMLARRQVDIAQTATSLGFSESSTFQRAFKRWTGVPAGEYRRRTRGG